jgi:potassium-transporting ATPase KdpC subunit
MSVALFTLLTGFVFPFAITAIASVAFPHQAHGSLVTQNGMVIGSDLIGQTFTKPEYFHPRPSAAGNGYDAASSGGTNLGPTSSKLLQGIHNKTADGKDDPSNFDGVADLARAYRAENRLAEGTPIPADAVTRSASGLDPHISLANATLQAARVAKARGKHVEDVQRLIDQQTEPPTFGVLGEARVNVLALNRALDH